MAALTAGDPWQPVGWVTGQVKPATLATTRLAEHWAHGLDITGPLGIDFPDTERLRHVAWLAHRTLPYALSAAGEQAAPVRIEVTAPDGADTWRFGPADAESAITGAAPVPVPPPMPAVTNTMSAPCSASSMSSRDSAALPLAPSWKPPSPSAPPTRAPRPPPHLSAWLASAFISSAAPKAPA